MFLSRNHRSFQYLMLTAMLAVVLALPMLSMNVHAEDATPINPVVWANSWGSINVYCIDQNGAVSAHHEGGFRVIRKDDNGSTSIAFFAPKANIIKAALASRSSNKPVAITPTQTTGLYTIYVQPETDSSMTEFKFSIYSKPDAQGKTLLGWWHECQPELPAISTATPELCFFQEIEEWIPCDQIPA